MTYQVVTVSNRNPQEWYFLQKQFYQSLLPFNALTINYTDSVWKGLATKPKWLYRAIKDGSIKGERMVFVDSWDLVFGAPVNEVIGKFESMNCDILISAEKNCFPDTHKKAFDELSFPEPYRYVNSGVIIGGTNAILTCLETMDLENVADDHWDAEKGQAYHSNDQTMWQEIFLKQPVKISLDYAQFISQSLHDETSDNFDFNGERIMNKITGTQPSVWHFNGASKDKNELRQPILSKLNLL